jgi:hypothetical protein
MYADAGVHMFKLGQSRAPQKVQAASCLLANPYKTKFIAGEVTALIQQGAPLRAERFDDPVRVAGTFVPVSALRAGESGISSTLSLVSLRRVSTHVND